MKRIHLLIALGLLLVFASVGYALRDAPVRWVRAFSTRIFYGNLYHLENQWTGRKTFLDTCGLASCSPTTDLAVVTDPLPDRAGDGTGTWKIVSATGTLNDGDPVHIGDLIHLENQWTGGKSFLDTCGLASCSPTTDLAVVTDPLPDRAGDGTGTWKIVSATGTLNDGDLVLLGDLIYLENQWTGGKSFLDTCGLASCSPTTDLAVVTDPLPDRAGQRTGTWKIVSIRSSP